jgi:methionyl-tRNA synthetase
VFITAQYTDLLEKWWRKPPGCSIVSVYRELQRRLSFCDFPWFSNRHWGNLDEAAPPLYTDYLTYEGRKVFKSRGIGVFGDSAQETVIPSIVWRYYLLSDRPETGDSRFTWGTFIRANNNMLLKNVGNFVNCVLKFVNSQHCINVVPSWTGYNEALFDT